MSTIATGIEYGYIKVDPKKFHLLVKVLIILSLPNDEDNKLADAMAILKNYNIKEPELLDAITTEYFHYTSALGGILNTLDLFTERTEVVNYGRGCKIVHKTEVDVDRFHKLMRAYIGINTSDRRLKNDIKGYQILKSIEVHPQNLFSELKKEFNKYTWQLEKLFNNLQSLPTVRVY